MRALSSSMRVLFWFSSTATRFSRHLTYSFFFLRHSLAASLEPIQGKWLQEQPQYGKDWINEITCNPIGSTITKTTTTTSTNCWIAQTEQHVTAISNSVVKTQFKTMKTTGNKFITKHNNGINALKNWEKHNKWWHNDLNCRTQDQKQHFLLQSHSILCVYQDHDLRIQTLTFKPKEFTFRKHKLNDTLSRWKARCHILKHAVVFDHNVAIYSRIPSSYSMPAFWTVHINDLVVGKRQPRAIPIAPLRTMLCQWL